MYQSFDGFYSLSFEIFPCATDKANAKKTLHHCLPYANCSQNHEFEEQNNPKPRKFAFVGQGENA